MRHISLKLAVISLALLPLSTAMAQSTERGEPNDNQRMMEGFGIAIPSDKQYKKLVKKAYKHPLGSQKNPVRADAAQGQREYLNRLRCADGSRPEYARSGNVGEGVYGYIVDLYEVDCGDAAPGTTQVYMDLYHGGYVEQELVEGFYFEDQLPAQESPTAPDASPDISPDGNPVILQQPDVKNAPQNDTVLPDPV